MAPQAQSAEARAAEAKTEAFLQRQQRERDDAHNAELARERRARDARELFAPRPAAAIDAGEEGGGAAADAAARRRADDRRAFLSAVVGELRSLGAPDGVVVDLLTEVMAS